MFRLGGNTDQGIMSGVVPRQGYDKGGVARRKEMLMQGMGQRPDTSMANFLIDFGLNVASAPPTGSIFSTAAGAAKEPFQRYQATKADRAAMDQQIGLSAATMALEQEQARKLAMLKNKTDIGNIRKNARDIVNSGMINPDTNEPYTDTEAFEKAYRDAETSPGKSKQDRWDNVYNKQDPNIVPPNVAENRADFVVYIRPNIPPNVYGGSVPTTVQGKGAAAVDVVDPTKMEPGKVYWDEVSGTMFEVVENEEGERIPQEVVGWRDKYYKR